MILSGQTVSTGNNTTNTARTEEIQLLLIFTFQKPVWGWGENLKTSQEITCTDFIMTLNTWQGLRPFLKRSIHWVKFKSKTSHCFHRQFVLTRNLSGVSNSLPLRFWKRAFPKVFSSLKLHVFLCRRLEFKSIFLPSNHSGSSTWVHPASCPPFPSQRYPSFF